MASATASSPTPDLWVPPAPGMAAPAGIPAIGYIRVSTAREEMISPELQRDHITRWARTHGRVIVEWVEDLDMTGRNFNRRILYAIERVEGGHAREIAVWKYSRFGRNRAGSAINLARLESAGGQLQSATEQVDATTALGRLTRGVLLELAAFQSDMIGESWRDVHAYRIAQGLPNSGRARFGYVRRGRIRVSADQWARDPADERGERYEIDPQTGPILAEMYERAAAGDSGYSICRWLNGLGVPGPRGRVGQWTHGTLWPLLDSGWGAGLLRVHDPACTIHALDSRGWCRNRTWIPGAHTAVIDGGETAGPTWQAYRRRREMSPTVPPRTREARHELTATIRCGWCGRTMAAHRNTMRGKKLDTFSWRCAGRTHGTCERTNSVSDRMARAAVRAVLEAEHERLAVAEAEAAAVAAGQGAPVPERDRAAEIDAELGRLTASIDRLVERYAEDEIPRDAYQRTRDRYLERRAELEAERAALDEPDRVDYVPVVRGLLDEWDTLPVARRNAMLRDLVELTAFREDRRNAYVVIRTAWGSEHRAPAAEPMGRPRRKMPA